MAWFKVDDKFHDHRKARAAGPSALGLWMLAGSWCADNLTDGFVPDDVLPRWGARGFDVWAQADRLVEAGLWSRDSREGEEGHLFHGWEDYQPTRAQVEANRAAARERMANARANKRGGSQDVRANSEGTSQQVRVTPSRPVPSRPDPKEEPSSQLTLVTESDGGDTFSFFWLCYPRKVGKAAAAKAWDKAVKRATPAVIQAGARRLATDPNLPELQFVPHPATWLNRDGWLDEPYPPRQKAKGEGIDWDAAAQRAAQREANGGAW